MSYKKTNKINNKAIESRVKKQDSKNSKKAFMLLAKQENISLNHAKRLIDSGLVSVKNERVLIARALMPQNTRFEVMESRFDIVFEDADLLVIDKGVGVESYSLEGHFKPFKLINRLDRDTSGLIFLAKSDEIRNLAIKEFKAKNVQKIYLALVQGKIIDEIVIKNRIFTKKDSKAKSFIESKNAKNTDSKEAISIIKPLRLINGATLVEVQILTGATHQIRVHLASINHAILGDIIYNKDSKIKKRLMLHCQKTTLFGREFISKMNVDKEFEIT